MEFKGYLNLWRSKEVVFKYMYRSTPVQSHGVEGYVPECTGVMQDSKKNCSAQKNIYIKLHNKKFQQQTNQLWEWNDYDLC